MTEQCDFSAEERKGEFWWRSRKSQNRKSSINGDSCVLILSLIDENDDDDEDGDILWKGQTAQKRFPSLYISRMNLAKAEIKLST